MISNSICSLASPNSKFHGIMTVVLVLLMVLPAMMTLAADERQVNAAAPAPLQKPRSNADTGWDVKNAYPAHGENALPTTMRVPRTPEGASVASTGGSHAVDRQLLGLEHAMNGQEKRLVDQTVRFEKNEGQTHPDANFLARAAGRTFFFTETEVITVLTPPQLVPDDANDATMQSVVRMRLSGAHPAPFVIGIEELPGVSNYLGGNDPAKWVTSVPSYAGVKYNEVYPDIDLLFYSNAGNVEYDFVVAAGANPGVIEIAFAGADPTLDSEGNLVLSTRAGGLLHAAPRIYQEIGGTRHEVQGSYAINDDGNVTFAIGTFDEGLPLVIDPIIYSTYLGGTSNDGARGIAVDPSGSTYVAGYASSADFPVFNPIQERRGPSQDSDIFITKLNPAGDSLVYSTYLGGSTTDILGGITVDSSGNVYVAGNTMSSDFPTLNPIQDSLRDGGDTGDVFVAKLNAAGNALAYATYLGGSRGDRAESIAIDSSGSAYITGMTDSTDFPTTPGAIQPTHHAGGYGWDAFVSKLSAAGDALVYSTYVGGTSNDWAYDIAVDFEGSTYITGSTTHSADFPTVNAVQPTYNGGNGDGFVTKLNPAGSAFAYSTFLGGSGFDSGGQGIAVDSAGNAYVTGGTSSGDFPTSNAFQSKFAGSVDVFVTKLNAAGNTFLFSTFLGGSQNEAGHAIAVNENGGVYVTGFTHSGSGFPLANADQTRFGGGYQDAFVTVLSPTGDALVYSTYLGGSHNDNGMGIAVDSGGIAYVTGETSSTNFPTARAFQSTSSGGVDAFVTRIQPQGAIQLSTPNNPQPGTANGNGPELPLTPRFSWSAVPNAENYHVEIYDADSSVLVDYIDFLAELYYDVPSGKLSTGHNYKWHVKALPAPGSTAYTASEYTAHLKFHTATGPPPAISWSTQPPNTMASGATATISWTTPGTPDHTHVHWDPNDPTGNCCTANTLTSGSSGSLSTNSYMITAPTVGSPTTIKYVVHYHTSAGSGYYTNVSLVSVNPSSAGQLATPGNPQPGEPSGRGPELSLTPRFTWSAVPNADNYHIEIYDTDSGTKVDHGDYLTQTYYDVPAGKLSAGHNYEWHVKAFPLSGSTAYTASEYTTHLNFHTTASAGAGGPPGKPTKLQPGTPASSTATSTAGPTLPTTSLTLTWAAPTTGAEKYGVYVSKAPYSGPLVIENEAVTGTSLTTALQCGSTYRWNVRAYTSAGGWGELAPNPDRMYFTTKACETLFTLSNETPVCDTNPPAAPAVRLNWGASNGATSYKVYRNGAQIGSTLDSHARTFYNNANLAEGQTYTYYIQSASNGGTTNSNTISVTILNGLCNKATIPSAPQSLGVQTISRNELKLTWAAPSSNGGASITDYRIYRNTTSGGEAYYTNIGGVGYEFANRGANVVCGTTYTYRVTAVNNQGEGAYSSYASGTTSACAVAAPGAPTSLRPGNQAAASATSTPGEQLPGLSTTIRWDAATGSVDKYRVYLNKAPYSLPATYNGIEVTSTSWTTPTLECGTSYRYQVEAVNSGGATTGPTPTSDRMYFRTSACADPTPDSPTGPTAPTDCDRRTSVMVCPPTSASNGKTVVISPGHQPKSPNVFPCGALAGKTSEFVEAWKIALALTAELRLNGVTVVVPIQPADDSPLLSATQFYAPRLAAAQDLKADAYVAIHSNAGGGGCGAAPGGTQLLWMTEDDKAIAQAVFNELKAISPGTASEKLCGDSTCSPSWPIFELNDPRARAIPTAYVEVEYHSTTIGADWIVQNTNAAAGAIADGIANYFGLTKPSAAAQANLRLIVEQRPSEITQGPARWHMRVVNDGGTMSEPAKLTIKSVGSPLGTKILASANVPPIEGGKALELRLAADPPFGFVDYELELVGESRQRYASEVGTVFVAGPTTREALQVEILGKIYTPVFHFDERIIPAPSSVDEGSQLAGYIREKAVTGGTIHFLGIVLRDQQGHLSRDRAVYHEYFWRSVAPTARAGLNAGASSPHPDEANVYRQVDIFMDLRTDMHIADYASVDLGLLMDDVFGGGENARRRIEGELLAFAYGPPPIEDPKMKEDRTRTILVLQAAGILAELAGHSGWATRTAGDLIELAGKGIDFESAYLERYRGVPMLEALAQECTSARQQLVEAESRVELMHELRAGLTMTKLSSRAEYRDAMTRAIDQVQADRNVISNRLVLVCNSDLTAEEVARAIAASPSILDEVRANAAIRATGEAAGDLVLGSALKYVVTKLGGKAGGGLLTGAVIGGSISNHITNVRETYGHSQTAVEASLLWYEATGAEALAESVAKSEPTGATARRELVLEGARRTFTADWTDAVAEIGSGFFFGWFGGGNEAQQRADAVMDRDAVENGLRARARDITHELLSMNLRGATPETASWTTTTFRSPIAPGPLTPTARITMASEPGARAIMLAVEGGCRAARGTDEPCDKVFSRTNLYMSDGSTTTVDSPLFARPLQTPLRVPILLPSDLVRGDITIDRCGQWARPGVPMASTVTFEFDSNQVRVKTAPAARSCVGMQSPADVLIQTSVGAIGWSNETIVNTIDGARRYVDDHEKWYFLGDATIQGVQVAGLGNGTYTLTIAQGAIGGSSDTVLRLANVSTSENAIDRVEFSSQDGAPVMVIALPSQFNVSMSRVEWDGSSSVATASVESRPGVALQLVATEIPIPTGEAANERVVLDSSRSIRIAPLPKGLREGNRAELVAEPQDESNWTALRWWVNGIFVGEGPNVTTSALLPGNHVIVLLAADRSAEAVATLAFNVEAIEPSVPVQQNWTGDMPPPSSNLPQFPTTPPPTPGGSAVPAPPLFGSVLAACLVAILLRARRRPF